MKIQNIPFWFGIVILLFCSCNNNDFPDTSQGEDLTESIPVNLHQALRAVDRMMTVLDGGQTRSSRRIATIEKVEKPYTRTSENEVNLYVVNYENDGGFALVTDAPVASPVFGISNEGSLSMGDTVQNKGLALVIEGIRETVNTMGEVIPDPRGPFDQDSLKKGNTPPGYYPNDPINPPVEVLKVAPLLTPTVAKWTQEDPFNCLCAMVTDPKTGNTKRGLVGCTPLAVSMIMSHYSWPDSYYSKSPDMTFNFDWDLVRNSTYRYVISQLTREVSREYNLDAQWKYKGTSAKTSHIPRTFKNFKYNEPEEKAFLETAISTLNAGFPVLVYGPGIEDAHTWVVDGLLVEYANDASLIPGYSTNYYHCVWGWGGINNGYFYMSCNEVDADNAFKWDGDHKITGHKFYDLKCIGQVYPQR